MTKFQRRVDPVTCKPDERMSGGKFDTPKLRHKTPCAECPWRRKHPAGWLGGYEPEAFTKQVHHDGPPLSCHRTDSMNPPSMCAGALVHMKNSVKSARHPAYGNALDKVAGDSVNVFEWPHEFVAYHKDPDGWIKQVAKK